MTLPNREGRSKDGSRPQEEINCGKEGGEEAERRSSNPFEDDPEIRATLPPNRLKKPREDSKGTERQLRQNTEDFLAKLMESMSVETRGTKKKRRSPSPKPNPNHTTSMSLRPSTPSPSMHRSRMSRSQSPQEDIARGESDPGINQAPRKRIRSKGSKRRNNYSKEVRRVLENWFECNLHHPYPDRVQKLDLSKKSGLTPAQVTQWFLNKRKRDDRWKRLARSPTREGKENTAKKIALRRNQTTAEGRLSPVDLCMPVIDTRSLAVPMQDTDNNDGNPKTLAEEMFPDLLTALSGLPAPIDSEHVELDF
ncbi:hypothetical protein AAMO2058_001293700 [Amorphochlora amoebiformis]